ncbi:flavodoxin domain-containing protein [Desulfuribacillus alkaliarsenatis]|uniref:Flavodoxin-like domain-containing protein n=1 Tax=Desulfuribacillus alkaliarsenatis TaxID=766136 RepID=A0A1E5G4T6_9FIRM|nr:flavodoxin domain-containing protein [Desulfuribacillus alkaliarsenatis]OEF98129.1 hypothetical protein BHF68_00095 [Desulfuribacillus alkaliarsenatis]
MKKIGMFLASMTGNTEAIGNEIKKQLYEFQVDIYLMEYIDCEADFMLEDYEILLFGAYTWGDGILPFEAEKTYELLSKYDLTGKIVGVFGSGDFAYPNYCVVVDMFEERARQQNGKLVLPSIRMELGPDSEGKLQIIKDFTNSIKEMYQWSLQK